MLRVLMGLRVLMVLRGLRDPRGITGLPRVCWRLGAKNNHPKARLGPEVPPRRLFGRPVTLRLKDRGFGEKRP